MPLSVRSEPAPAPGAVQDEQSTPALDCTFPSDAPARADIHIECAVAPSLGVAKVMLRFRPAGRYAFLGMAMAPGGERRWQAIISGHMLVGPSVHLFVEGADRAGKVIVGSGTADGPHAVLLIASSSDEPGQTVAQAPAVVEENPLEDREDRSAEYRRRRLWVALSIGDGFGWSKETRRYSGSAPAGSLDLHLAPELGYHLSPRISVSVAGRHQWIQQPSRDGAGAASAHLALARLHAFSGTGRHRLFGVGMAGAGDGFRLVTQRAADMSRSSARGGPFVAGLGAGYTGDLSRSRLAFAVEADGLAGFPDAAVVVDLRLGLAAYF